MKIVLSLTAHENIDCFHDLIENIRQCFVHYDILVLVSMTDSLYTLYRPKHDFVKIVTRRTSYNIWGKIHLFHQHILNLRYLETHHIPYDHFWLVASNEMFVEVIPPTFLQDHGMVLQEKQHVISKEDYEDYYKTFLETSSEWWGFNACKKDDHFMNYAYTHQYKLTKCDHEGLVLPYNVSREILDEYTNHHLYEKSTFSDYVMEEIFVPTYLFGKYTVVKFPRFCYHYLYHLGKYASYEEIEKKRSPHHVSVKPVHRRMNHPLRVRIRNKFVRPTVRPLTLFRLGYVR